MANPTMNDRMTQTTKTEDRNSRNGRIGSAARRSTSTKIAKETREPMIMAMMVSELHAYSVPPQDKARVRPAAPMDTNTMPR
jgi:hypothetical protein